MGKVNFLSLFCLELQKFKKIQYMSELGKLDNGMGEEQQLSFEQIKNRLV